MAATRVGTRSNAMRPQPRLASERRAFNWRSRFLLLCAAVDACMPGYEAERAKLREYLGIEWVPKAMEKADCERWSPFLAALKIVARLQLNL